MYHRHLPQCVCEGVGNSFCVGPRRTNTDIISVSEGKLSNGRYVGRPLPTSLKNLLFYRSDMTYTASSVYPAYPFIPMRGYLISIHYITHCTTIDFMMV